MNLDIKGFKDEKLIWNKEKNVTEPAIKTAGLEMRLVYIPKGEFFITKEEFLVIVTVLRGKIKDLSEKETKIFQGEKIIAIDDTLLFICYDLGDQGIIKGEIIGPVKWIEVAEGRFRTDPKIEIDGYKINLWYLVPNINGGIHKHSKENFIEFHVQLRGDGKMVKYKEKDESTANFTEKLNFGDSHKTYATVKDGKAVYPYHAYVTGEKGSLFIAFEDYRV